jgi:hypothetical protein
MKKHPKKTVVLYFDSITESYRLRDEHGWMIGWTAEFNTLADVLRETHAYLEYYKLCYAKCPVEFVIDPSVYTEAVEREGG